MSLTLAEIEELEDILSAREQLPHLYGFPWYKWAKDFFDSTNKACFLTAANQCSKAKLLSCDIPTPNGFMKMSEINIGDYVFGRDGRASRVIDIPYIGEDEAFEFEFNDGTTTVASINHEWICKGYEERFRKNYTFGRGKNKGIKFPNETYGKWKVLSTRDIITFGKYSPQTTPTKRFSIPVTAPVQYEEKDLFDPYYVGVYIGNGSTRSITNNASDADVNGHCVQYGNARSKGGVTGITQEIWQKIVRLGLAVLSCDKFIPEEYMRGSIEQRQALLAGLMDTDGTCSDKGQHCTYCTTSPILAQQVQELVCSLGAMAETRKYPSFYYKIDTREKVICKDHYTVSLYTDFNPFRSKRKSANWKPNSRYKHERVITKITPVGKRKMKCITVDNDDGSFLCTRNYIVTHNSSTQIRKIIDWATDQSKWPKLWPNLLRGQKPNQFWYFYPTVEVWQTEFESKWVPDFLPKDKDDPTYGWKEFKDKGFIKKIEFKSGVTIYCKTYKQAIKDLQTGSVYYLALDEEAPVEYIPELQARLRATNGYISAVFTATLGQEYWRQIMEPSNKEEEIYPHAQKQTISLYDCQTYLDGKKTRWTTERITEIIAECTSDSEVQRRVFGRFVKSGGLRYDSFELERNTITPQVIPKSWGIFSGVDPGSGGSSGHPAAIIFIAVRPDYKLGYVFKGWRGDGIATANPDILKKYRELKGKMLTMSQVYDYKDKDFFLVAQSQGEAFSMANKSRDEGFGLVNSLFKRGMLKIFKGDPELAKLVAELMSLSATVDKRKAVDDLADSVRYCSMSIPWDFSLDETTDENKFDDAPDDTRTEEQRLRDELLKSRREFALNMSSGVDDSYDAEIEYLNELNGAGND